MKNDTHIFIYGFSYKLLIGAQKLLVKFNKIDEFIRTYDGDRYLVLFGLEKYDVICNRIRYIISQKKQYNLCFLLINTQKSKLILMILITIYYNTH